VALKKESETARRKPGGDVAIANHIEGGVVHVLPEDPEEENRGRREKEQERKES